MTTSKTKVKTTTVKKPSPRKTTVTPSKKSHKVDINKIASSYTIDELRAAFISKLQTETQKYLDGIRSSNNLKACEAVLFMEDYLRINGISGIEYVIEDDVDNDRLLVVLEARDNI